MRKSADVLKYQSRNPFKRFLTDHFLKKVTHEIENIKPNTIIDLGCGEGFIEEHLVKKGFKGKILGIDMNEEVINKAKKRNPKLEFKKGDIFSLNISRKFDLVLLFEVIEHLNYPQKALGVAEGLSNKIIISVPYEPWFSWLSFLGGNYLLRLGKHPDHVHFFTKSKLVELLSKNFSNHKIITSLPWLIAVCQNN